MPRNKKEKEGSGIDHSLTQEDNVRLLISQTNDNIIYDLYSQNQNSDTIDENEKNQDFPGMNKSSSSAERVFETDQHDIEQIGNSIERIIKTEMDDNEKQINNKQINRVQKVYTNKEQVESKIQEQHYEIVNRLMKQEQNQFDQQLGRKNQIFVSNPKINSEYLYNQNFIKNKRACSQISNYYNKDKLGINNNYQSHNQIRTQENEQDDIVELEKQNDYSNRRSSYHPKQQRLSLIRSNNCLKNSKTNNNLQNYQRERRSTSLRKQQLSNERKFKNISIEKSSINIQANNQQPQQGLTKPKAVQAQWMQVYSNASKNNQQILQKTKIPKYAYNQNQSENINNKSKLQLSSQKVYNINQNQNLPIRNERNKSISSMKPLATKGSVQYNNEDSINSFNEKNKNQLINFIQLQIHQKQNQQMHLKKLQFPVIEKNNSRFTDLKKIYSNVN